MTVSKYSMKKLITISLIRIISIVFSILVSTSYAQEQETFTLEGKVIETETKRPIPHASIRIKNKQIGTIANEQGIFIFQIQEKYINDTLVVSAIGYANYSEVINNLIHKPQIIITLNDSLFLIDEIIAICYDHFEALYWSTKDEKNKRYLLSFATIKMATATNFITVLKEKLGIYKVKPNIIKWKNVSIKGIKEKKINISLLYFPCPYCPFPDEVVVAIGIDDKKKKNLLYNKKHKKRLTTYFQKLLDKSIAQGVDFRQLENRDKKMYVKGEKEPYTGGCFGYFENGQKGLEGTYKHGIKNGKWIWLYSNGQTKKEISYKNGKKNGKTIFWYKNGQNRLEVNYRNDKMIGKYTLWYENGQKKKETIYKNGVFVEKIEWNKSGKIIYQ